MNVRPIGEEDIEQVINLFRLNYGDDYAIPEFYDPQWVKRGIYSDHILWLVIEDEGKVVASGAAILDFGDYNDQIAEIGRLVVDPSVGGRGLGRTLLDALVDASDDRVAFAFGEARTTHIKTQRIFDRVGLVPLGFLPMAYLMKWRESWVLSGQLFENGRRLRHGNRVEVIPEVAAIAGLALSNLGIEEAVCVRADVRGYPLSEPFEITPLSGSSLIRLLKIEQGRVVDPEVFGGLHLDQGVSHLKARKASYLVASDGHDTLGAIGYIPDEASRNVRIVELVGKDDAVKGALLRRAVEEAEEIHEAEVIDCDVSAASPRIQRTLVEMGFLPVAYVPGMVFHHTERWDVVRMMKLNTAWELGPLELTENAQAMFDVVTPAFIRRDAQRRNSLVAKKAAVLKGLSTLELDFVQRAGSEIMLEQGSSLRVEGLYILLDGEVARGQERLKGGQSFGEAVLLGGSERIDVHAIESSRLLRLMPYDFRDLCERHPRLGVKLYRQLTANVLNGEN
jgi:RimJ/RimL family protein N-acetyltransferase